MAEKDHPMMHPEGELKREGHERVTLQMDAIRFEGENRTLYLVPANGFTVVTLDKTRHIKEIDLKGHKPDCALELDAGEPGSAGLGCTCGFDDG